MSKKKNSPPEATEPPAATPATATAEKPKTSKAEMLALVKSLPGMFNRDFNAVEAQRRCDPLFDVDSYKGTDITPLDFLPVVRGIEMQPKEARNESMELFIAGIIEVCVQSIPPIDWENLVILDKSEAGTEDEQREACLFAACLCKRGKFDLTVLTAVSQPITVPKFRTVMDLFLLFRRIPRGVGFNSPAIFVTARVPYERIVVISPRPFWKEEAPTIEMQAYKRRNPRAKCRVFLVGHPAAPSSDGDAKEVEAYTAIDGKAFRTIAKSV